jgi:hypothetical protein
MISPNGTLSDNRVCAGLFLQYFEDEIGWHWLFAYPEEKTFKEKMGKFI